MNPAREAKPLEGYRKVFAAPGAMEDMDLVVVPSARRVIVNPQHPNFASGPAKGFAARH